MNKVTVHITPSYNRKGYATSWSKYNVFAGPNPFGPQGGRCSDCVDADLMGGPFSERIKAIRLAMSLAAKNGWEWVPCQTDERHLAIAKVRDENTARRKAESDAKKVALKAAKLAATSTVAAPA